MPSEEARRRMNEVRRLWADYLEADLRLLEAAGKGESHFQEARALAAGVTATSYSAVIKELSTVTAWSNERGKETSEAASAEYSEGLYLSIAAIVRALGLGVVLALAITASITLPLKEGVAIAEAVASEDLTRQIETSGRDEVAELLRSMQQTSSSLSTLVGHVRDCSVTIAHGSHEIASGNLDLSRRTEEQASNLEEPAASMEEFTTIAQSNSDTARQADELATSATSAALGGGTAVEAVVETMSKILDASRKISEIDGLVDGIAFQTNILALNAAVEAARAGPQGRSFAVVAAEVRSLAQRSAVAAREIKTLIDDSVATVEVEADQAAAAGRSMKEIVSQITGVGQLIASISSATAEQTAGIAQVGEAINQMDRVTQQNAALVEQSAAAAESLKTQADQLSEMVAAFKVVDGHRPAIA